LTFAEYLSLGLRNKKFEREDSRMLELVNRAYRLCILGYGESEGL